MKIGISNFSCGCSSLVKYTIYKGIYLFEYFEQISGEFVNVQDALYHITGRLRDNLFPSKTLNGAGIRSSSAMNEISPYGRVRDPASFGLHSSVGVSPSFSRHTTLTQSMDHLGLSHSLDHPTSPRLWPSQVKALPSLS